LKRFKEAVPCPMPGSGCPEAEPTTGCEKINYCISTSLSSCEGSALTGDLHA
jgi:hypothetical protein